MRCNRVLGGGGRLTTEVMVFSARPIFLPSLRWLLQILTGFVRFRSVPGDTEPVDRGMEAYASAREAVLAESDSSLRPSKTRNRTRGGRRRSRRRRRSTTICATPTHFLYLPLNKPTDKNMPAIPTPIPTTLTAIVDVKMLGYGPSAGVSTATISPALSSSRAPMRPFTLPLATASLVWSTA